MKIYVPITHEYLKNAFHYVLRIVIVIKAERTESIYLFLLCFAIVKISQKTFIKLRNLLLHHNDEKSRIKQNALDN